MCSNFIFLPVMKAKKKSIDVLGRLVKHITGSCFAVKSFLENSPKIICEFSDEQSSLNFLFFPPQPIKLSCFPRSLKVGWKNKNLGSLAECVHSGNYGGTSFTGRTIMLLTKSSNEACERVNVGKKWLHSSAFSRNRDSDLKTMSQ